MTLKTTPIGKHTQIILGDGWQRFAFATRGMTFLGTIRRGMEIGALAKDDTGGYLQVNGDIHQVLNRSRVGPPAKPTSGLNLSGGPTNQQRPRSSGFGGDQASAPNSDAAGVASRVRLLTRGRKALVGFKSSCAIDLRAPNGLVLGRRGPARQSSPARLSTFAIFDRFAAGKTTRNFKGLRAVSKPSGGTLSKSGCRRVPFLAATD